MVYRICAGGFWAGWLLLSHKNKHPDMNQKKTYSTPQCEPIDLELGGVMCGSPDGTNNEKFTVYGASYGDGDFE